MDGNIHENPSVREEGRQHLPLIPQREWNESTFENEDMRMLSDKVNRRLEAIEEISKKGLTIRLEALDRVDVESRLNRKVHGRFGGGPTVPRVNGITWPTLPKR